MMKKENILGINIIGHGEAQFTNPEQNIKLKKNVEQVFIPLSRQTLDLLTSY